MTYILEKSHSLCSSEFIDRIIKQFGHLERMRLRTISMISLEQVTLATGTFMRLVRRPVSESQISPKSSPDLVCTSSHLHMYIQVLWILFLFVQLFMSIVIVATEHVPLTTYVLADLDSEAGLALIKEAVASLVCYIHIYRFFGF